MLNQFMLIILVACHTRNRLNPCYPHPNRGAVKKSDLDWKTELSPMEYKVLRKKGTERHLPVTCWMKTETVFTPVRRAEKFV